MSEPYVGEIRMVGFNFAPVNWALCQGQLLSISQNSVLFDLIGTTYGGDGVNTFGLPDLQGRLPIHQGTGPGLSSYVIGQRSGSESVTLISNQMPQHNHVAEASNAPATRTLASGSVIAAPTDVLYALPANLTPMAASPVSTTGGSTSHTNFQPYLCVTFIISLFGVFPSQG